MSNEFSLEDNWDLPAEPAPVEAPVDASVEAPVGAPAAWGNSQSGGMSPDMLAILAGVNLVSQNVPGLAGASFMGSSLAGLGSPADAVRTSDAGLLGKQNDNALGTNNNNISNPDATGGGFWAWLNGTMKGIGGKEVLAATGLGAAAILKRSSDKERLAQDKAHYERSDTTAEQLASLKASQQANAATSMHGVVANMGQGLVNTQVAGGLNARRTRNGLLNFAGVPA